MKLFVKKNNTNVVANRCFIIAEAGINHNGDIKLAKKMIDVVKESGADCIKFQTFQSKEFIADSHLTHTYQSQGKTITESQLKMFQRYEFSKKEWSDIIDYCKKRGVAFSTTAQNQSDLDMILSLTDLPFIKVGSDDLTNVDLLQYYASKGKPMIISAGMAYASEIEDAVMAIRKRGNNNIVVLHCVASYPATAEEVNLKKIYTIKKIFGVDVGFSDHTIGSAAAVGAVCFGATVIEKHFTLDHNLPGPDHWFAADKEEFTHYVRDIRFIEKAIGVSMLGPTEKEKTMREVARRSIVAKTIITKGEKFSNNNLEFKRPGTGIPPKYISFMVGKLAKKNFKKGYVFKHNDW